RQYVCRDILREIPGVHTVSQIEFHGGKIAGMVSVTWSDGQRHHIARTHPNILKRTKFHYRSILGEAGRKLLASIAAPQFDRPGNTITALDVSMLDASLHANSCCHRTTPAGYYTKRRGGMHCDTVWFHVSRNAHVVIRRIGEHAQGLRPSP